MAITARIGHIGIEVSDVAASRKFYDALLGSLGFRLVGESGEHAGYSDGSTQIWIARSTPRRVSRLPPSGDEEVVSDHVAFLVEGRGSVDRVSSEMEKNGFEPLFPPRGAPGVRRRVLRRILRGSRPLRHRGLRDRPKKGLSASAAPSSRCVPVQNPISLR
ncbi:MAG: VOC family protein [Candidatus Methanosuratincola petrocarbonis]